MIPIFLFQIVLFQTFLSKCHLIQKVHQIQSKYSAYDLSVDPCPDSDIRFSDESEKPVLAPASVLTKNRWKKQLFKSTVILIGTPSHITAAYLRETASCWVCEYFDPAGGKIGKKTTNRIKKWFEEKLTLRLG